MKLVIENITDMEELKKRSELWYKKGKEKYLGLYAKQKRNKNNYQIEIVLETGDEIKDYWSHHFCREDLSEG